MTIYDFKLTITDGSSYCLSKNKIILIVNVASKCDFTSQYKALQESYEKYSDDLEFEITKE